MLDQEEYIEQAYLFKTLLDRLADNLPLQDVLAHTREELLSTTKLPLAINFLLGELKHTGLMSSAMARLPHYFAPFQTYVMQEAEAERGRFDTRVALEILKSEADYRARSAAPQGLFFYQFECLCRNRLKYDPGLKAVSDDPWYNAEWQEWILAVRRQVGIVDLADMVYARSQHYANERRRHGPVDPATEKPILFGEKEGKIALANRQKDPLYLFSALQRHLGYPAVPRPRKPDDSPQQVHQISRRIERLETRIKLLEDEGKGGIDITKFYGPGPTPPPG